MEAIGARLIKFFIPLTLITYLAVSILWLNNFSVKTDRKLTKFETSSPKVRAVTVNLCYWGLFLLLEGLSAWSNLSMVDSSKF